MTEIGSRQLIVAERYRLECRAGKSWLAVHIATGNRVVLKPLASFEDPRVVQHLMKIRHPAIPRLLDKVSFQLPKLNSTSDPNTGFKSVETEFVVCEYLSGVTFSEWLLKAGGILPPADVIPLLAQTARILAFLHEQNEPQLLHLDLKPEHLVRMPGGQIGLIDYDCARVLPLEPVCRSTIRCTTGYAAPELLQGQPETASDIYAFGVIMLVLLTDLHADECNLPPLELLCRDLPVAVTKIINDCVKTDPKQRFSSASALAYSLEQLADNRSLLHQNVNNAFLESSTQQPRMLTTDGNGKTKLEVVEKSSQEKSGDADQQPLKNLLNQQLVVVWDHAEFAIEISNRLALSGKETIVIDVDLLNPRLDLLLNLSADASTAAQFSFDGSSQMTLETGQANTSAKPGLELALTSLMRQTLLPEYFPILLQNTETAHLKALTGSYLLRDYAHYDPRTLLQLFKTCRLHADTIVVRCGRFLHDSFTCLSLLAADLVLIPIHALPAEIREFNRYLDFLINQYPFERRKVRFVAIEHDPSIHLSWSMADTLCGGLLGGCISKGGLRKNTKHYAKRILIRHSVMASEVDQLLRRLGLLAL